MTDTTELTDDEREKVTRVLRDLVALERDRSLGYPESELHMDPLKALRQADDALEILGEDPEDIIWPDDRELLNLEREGGE